MNPFDSIRPSDSSERGRPPRSWTGEAQVQVLVACEEVEGDIAAYFDGEASDAAALRARRHLDCCAGCARMWRDWGDARLLLRTGHVPEVPDSWPQALVQRARLQMLLPTLFPTLSQEDEALCAQSTAPEPVPPGLHRAILERTTRPASTSASISTGGQDLRQSQSSSTSTRGARRFSWPIASARLPALAAWMLIITAPLAPQLPPPLSPPLLSSSTLLGMAGPLAPPPLQKSAPASATPISNLKADGASGQAPSPPAPKATSKASPKASDLVVVRPRRSHPAELAEPIDTPRQLEPTSTKEMAEAQRATRGEHSTSRLAPGARRARASQATVDAVDAVDEATRPATRTSPTSIVETHQHKHTTRVDKLAAITSSASSGARRAAGALRTSPQPNVETKLDRTRPQEAASSMDEARIAAHEPLDAAHDLSDLNDARPDEISEAVDAYAATWVDEDDGGL